MRIKERVSVGMVCPDWYPVIPASTKEGINEAIKFAHPDFVKSVEDMRNNIRSGGVLAPVKVKKNGNCYRIVSGNERFFAAILEGKETIDIEYD
ncbi:MAG: ParB/RepB/Spo0J family partition protein [Candidatus Thermoplasmatota archaeon]